MDKVFDWIYKFILLVMLISLVIMVTSVSANVIVRYFGRGFNWIEEVSSLAFVWMSFTSIVLGYHSEMHPGFDALMSKLNDSTKRLLKIIINILILVFLLYVLKGGIDYSIRSSIQKTAILSISVSWKYAAIPFSAFFMVIEALRKLTLLLRYKTNEINKAKSEVL